MLLEIDHVTKSFDGMTAVSDLSLSFDEGELHCIIGPNGSGKTTLFNLITGYFPLTSGRIRFEGKTISNLPAHKICRLGICRKFQNPNIFEDLSVEDNIRVAIISEHKIKDLLKKQDMKEADTQIEDILDTIQLTEKRKLGAASLSHGEKQWLEIGMVLSKMPHIVLLDEPTAGLTSMETSKTSELIRNISKRTTCIVIEHDLDFIRSLNCKITVLNRGKFLAEGSYNEIAANKEVRDVYLGDEI